MKERTRTITDYEAFDGVGFENEAECVRYEKENQWKRLVGLTEAQVQAAMAYEGDTDLADAIPTIGRRIEQARSSKGVVKRLRRAIESSNEPQLPPPVGVGEPGDSSEGAGRMEYEQSRANV
jgi:hypothetical protein